MEMLRFQLQYFQIKNFTLEGFGFLENLFQSKGIEKVQNFQ